MARNTQHTIENDIENQVNRKQEWLSILLGFITLEIAILSVERAKWLSPQPSLTFVLVLAVLAGVFIAKRTFRSWLKWIIVIAAGCVITAWQILAVLPESTAPWYKRLADTFGSAFGAFTGTQADDNSIHFVIFLVIVTWFLGTLATWGLVKKKNPWMVVVPGLFVILINLNNLPENYFGFLFGFLGAAVVLIGQVKLLDSIRTRRLFVNSGSKYFMVSVVIIGILAASISWSIPGISSGLLRNITPDDTPVLKNFQGYFANFFSTVPRKQPQIKAEEQESFTFDIPYERYGDDVHFIIDSASPHYWRTWVYDVYTSSGWENSPIKEEPEESTPVGSAPDSPYDRPEISYKVEVQLRTDIILSAGEYLSSNVPTSLYVLDYPGQVPPSEQPLMESDTTLSAVTPYTMVPGQSYTVTSAVTKATPSELASAGDTYPAWIKDLFLQLPDTLPDVIRQYAANVTANASTPYAKALAIVDSLSKLTYKRNTSILPEGDDAVDYFLFDKKEGACGDFASAMAILLRASGIPSRLCTGYRLGELDDKTGNYIVKVSNRHAWAEAYFPGYGWIEFEATPGEGRTLGVVGVEAFYPNDGSTTAWDPMRDFQNFMLYQTAGTGGTVTTSSPTAHKVDSSIVLIWPILLVGAGIVIAFIIYLVYLFRSRIRRTGKPSETDYETEAYTGLCTLAARAGMGPKPSQTPSEFCARLIAEFPRVGEYINVILTAFLNKRYGYVTAPDETIRWNLVKARRHVYDALRYRIEGKE